MEGRAIGELLYVYAVVPASARLAPEPTGIGAAPVRLIQEGLIAAAVSPVPAAEFDDEPLNRLMRDMDWLAPRATAHQTVNAALFERVDALLPLSFGAVYRGAGGVRRMLRERRAELLGRLDAVRGRSEWVATLQRDAERAGPAAEADDEELARLNAEIGTAQPGRAYLLRRRLEEARRAALTRLDRAATEALAQGLADVVERTHPEPIVQTTPDAPLARSSLLVHRAREGALVERGADFARRWEARGYALRLTGPWPPYRFGGEPLERGDATAI
ncbi:MAG TPA: GvpL/GvpF family gas vesicle protein [Chloroflexota bacterium]|nr:GvpL/GvpF family gas vesicle protein [Chloroflexota bacterium]